MHNEGLRGLPDQLLAGAERFVAWLDRTGYASYDPYDLWGTRYALWARRLYYAKNPLGAPLVGPVLLMEMFYPKLRALFVKKQRFATADAQLVLAFLNLHHLSSALRPPSSVLCLPNSQLSTLNSQLPAAWLTKAKALGEELLSYSIPGFSGPCWGYPFDWQNNRGLWRRNTPFITSTPYCYEAFAKLSEATGELSYLQVAESAARFVFEDLKDTSTGVGAAAASYGPYDDTQVVNASAYRAFVLFDAAERFDEPTYVDKARLNLNFILQSQRPDGSWLYAHNSPGEAFIDHFHTCFVLKNLAKIDRIAPDPRVRTAIERGYRYYRENLFDAQENPKYFSIQPRSQIVRLEMYNFAEAITLGTVLRDHIPEAFALAQRLAHRVVREYQLPDGHFVTRVYLGGLRHTLPFLRWPQAQMFYALTNVVAAYHGEGDRRSRTPKGSVLSTSLVSTDGSKTFGDRPT